MSQLSSSYQISTKVADRELLTSGIVHVESEDPIVISIDNLTFIFSFKNDESGPRYTGNYEGNTLNFDLFNHKNALGEGILTPIEVATMNGRPLSFTYYANTVTAGTNARRFEYAFYLGETK